MYERFTDRARRTMQYAHEEAARWNHEYVGTEHLLLGALRVDCGMLLSILQHFEIKPQKIRQEVDKLVQRGFDMVTHGKLPHTPRAAAALKYARGWAAKLDHNYVGTEHLLLGMLEEQEGVAAQILTNAGLSVRRVEDVLPKLIAERRKAIAAAPDKQPMEPAVRELGKALAQMLRNAGCSPTEIYRIGKAAEDPFLATSIAALVLSRGRLLEEKTRQEREAQLNEQLGMAFENTFLALAPERASLPQDLQGLTRLIASFELGEGERQALLALASSNK